jgi:hypothetical protein
MDKCRGRLDARSGLHPCKRTLQPVQLLLLGLNHQYPDGIGTAGLLVKACG